MNNQREEIMASVQETLDELRAAIEGFLEEEAGEEARGHLRAATMYIEAAIDSVDQARIVKED